MDAKDEVKQRLAVEDVVGDYLELKRSGRNLKALSPFSNEKTASLMVSPDKQIWHDFSSNKGGDIFTFVMEMEGVDFRESLEILARKAGVDLSQYSRGSGQNTKRKQKALETLSLATSYYYQTLVKNKHALSYVRKDRGYEKETITEFMIGYSPSGWDSLSKLLAKKGYTKQDLMDAGLAVERSGKLLDMFRGRVMVPLADGQGRTVGFTARLLPENDDSGPKYINTAQTILYDKSRHVFGLHLAKEAIRKSDEVVIVEGNMDVVASHQAGIRNVVATAGTALTQEQLKQLYHLSTNIKLAFDNDAAGLEATKRAIPIAQSLGIQLEIITLSGGKDPDELIKQDPSLWAKAIKNSVYVLDWVMSHYQQKNDLTTAQGKRDLSDEMIKVLKTVKDPVEQEHYLKKLAEITDSSLGTVQKKLQNADVSVKKRYKKPKAPIEKAKPDETAYIDTLLALNLAYPEARSSLRHLDSHKFKVPQRKVIYEYIKSIPSRQAVNKAPKELKQIENYVKILLLKAEELYASWNTNDRAVEAIGLARRLTKENLKDKKNSITVQIREAESSGNVEYAQKLLSDYHKLLKEE